LHLPLNVLPEQVLQVQQVTLPDDQQNSLQYDQSSMQWTLETNEDQKSHVTATGNALQSITTKLNEPLHIELMADGSMLPGAEQQGQNVVAADKSVMLGEILGPPLSRVSLKFILRNHTFWSNLKFRFPSLFFCICTCKGER